MTPSDHAAAASSGAGIGTLRPILQAARDTLIDETRLARGGVGNLARYSEQVDELMRRIYAAAREHTDASVAVVAVGGYGRKQVCLHSDIDLLFLFGRPIGAAEERFLKAMLHPLWDLRLDVGHHVRERTDLERADPGNPEFLAALHEARHLAGDPELYRELTATCRGPQAAWSTPILEALRELTRQRHLQFHGTLYQLEPDVKSAPGALRDVSAVRMITELGAFEERLDVPLGRVGEAEDFMLRIRSLLHLERGRNLNVLTHELQESVAKLFGSPGEQPAHQVETLMSTYFHHARIISRALGSSLKMLKRPTDASPVEVADGLERRGDEIWFTDATRASLRPRMWLRAFEAALDERCAVSDQVLTCIERHGGRYSPERFFPTIEERDLLLRVLQPRPGLYERLSEMHDSGLLGRMFPEFHRIYCRVIRDFYHKYTVDEHTLLTIRNLESLCTPTTRSRERFAGLLSEVASPELLVLALLFHDVGKWTNKNHSEEGVRLALGALRRIKMPERDTAVVEFLIRHHLQMSTAAFRRDTEDPEVVKQFSRLVGTEQRLKLLCVLTLADVEAVGPDVMTPWKAELLWRLYVDAYNQLTLGYGDEMIDPAASSLAELHKTRPDDITQADLEAFLEGLPHRYLRYVDASHVYEQVRLSKDLQTPEVHCTLEQKEGVWKLAVVSVDQHRLFSKVCGVLSYFGMDILRGQAMTNRQGIALDVVEFTDRERFFELNRSGQDELNRLLKDVLAGREDIERTLLPKQRGLVRRQPPRVSPWVHIDNELSERFSIVEIVAQDAWGLLYRISAGISREACDIDLVLISTEGDRAIDVFHVTKDGAKLSAEDTAVLQQRLEALLNEANETHQGSRATQ